jgi:hypothetical protein
MLSRGLGNMVNVHLIFRASDISMIGTIGALVIAAAQ